MKVDEVKKLQQKKYRQQWQHYLLEGEHLLLELFKAAQAQPYLLASEIFITEHYQEFMANHRHLGMKVTVVGEKTMSQISDTKTPQGIVAVVPFPEPSSVQHPQAIYLHEVQDPGNLGTILRTLAWFGGVECWLSANSVDPFSPKVVRSSMGALFHVNLVQNATLAAASARFPRVAYLDMQGQAIKTPAFSQFDLYVFGNEARGVPKAELQPLQARAFTIAGSGAIESLNLSQVVGMALYQLS